MLSAWSLFVPFIFGSVVGSFLNVLVWRLPRHESIVSPPSHCPKCEHRLGPLDLVPLLSILFLRARCRYCKAPFSWRYFVVELVTALLWA
ncbi:MAG: prepilin peptidase, partial [bacterium]